MKKFEEEVESLKKENLALREAIQQMNMSNVMHKLDYLFKVLEYSVHFSEEQLASAVGEISELLIKSNE